MHTAWGVKRVYQYAHNIDSTTFRSVGIVRQRYGALGRCCRPSVPYLGSGCAPCSCLGFGPAPQTMRHRRPCGTADHAAPQTMRHRRPCGTADHAAPQTMRHRRPCGTADHAAPQTMQGRTDQGGLKQASEEARAGVAAPRLG